MEISFILVEPGLPENVGSAARALKTMGFRNLILVNPCEWKEGKARWVAHGSADVLDNARVFDTVESAVEEFDFKIATTVRHRRVREDVTYLKDLLRLLTAKGSNLKKAAVLFGREDSGLSNHEVSLCDIVSEIPMADTYPSLNLAQAVMIYAYELSALNFLPEQGNRGTADTTVKALKKSIERNLKTLGLDESDCRYGRIMERISFLSGTDINLAFTLCGLLEKNLRKPHPDENK